MRINVEAFTEWLQRRAEFCREMSVICAEEGDAETARIFREEAGVYIAIKYVIETKDCDERAVFMEEEKE